MHEDSREHPRWREWYRQNKKEIEEKTEKKDAKAITIIVEGHEARGDDPIAPQNYDWADLLHNHGWDYKIGYSQIFKPAANVRSRDKTIDRSYIEAVKRGHPKITIVYQRPDGESGWTIDNLIMYGTSIKLVSDLKREITL
jgi:hypothetical protein